MPLDSTVSLKAASGVRKIIPEGIYQVQVIDIEESTMESKYGERPIFVFTCAVVDGDEKDHLLFFRATQTWNKGGNGYNASNLFRIVQVMYAHYQPAVDLGAVEVMTAEQFNGLIGKQFLAVVKISTDGKWNNITDFMKIKSPINYLAEDPVNPDDIPF